MRLLCLLFPRLDLHLALRQRPALEGRPFALLDGIGEDAIVAAASPEARAAGVFTGIAAAQARRRCPSTAFIPDTAGECLEELEAVASMIRTIATTLVAIGGRDHLFVDMRGLESFYATERAAARRLSSLAATWAGVEVRAGVASTRADALAAARVARFAPVIDETPDAGAEAPVVPFVPETLGVTLTFASPLDAATVRGRMYRALARLGVLLSARGEGFRDVRVEVESSSGPCIARVSMVQPRYDVDAVPGLVAARLAPDAFDGATAIRIELGRLCPDVRPGPCDVPVRDRRRMPALTRPARQMLLRAAG